MLNFGLLLISTLVLNRASSIWCLQVKYLAVNC